MLQGRSFGRPFLLGVSTVILSLRLLTPPAAEPVTLTQAKNQCRVTISTDDELISAYITAARELCERWTHRAFFNQTWRLTLDHFPLYPWWQGTSRITDRHDWWYYSSVWRGYMIQVPRPRLVSVTSIKYMDVTLTRRILDPDSYIIDGSSEPGRIVPAPGCFWPYTQVYQPGSVQIDFVAGSYGDGTQTGEVLAAAINAPGSGYAVGNTLTITQAGASGGALLVTGIGALGAVTSVAPLLGGSGYSIGTGLATTVAPAGGTACTVDITSISAGNFPVGIKMAILLLVSHFYEQREATSEETLKAIPMGVNDLLAPYVVSMFGYENN